MALTVEVRRVAMRYLGLRSLQSMFVLLGVSLLSFVFVELAPGNFFDEMKLNPRISSSTVTNLRKQYGIDQPLPVRYFRWLQSAAKGELGFSFAYNEPVGPLLWVRARNTLLLTGSATLLAWLIALPLGVLSAARQHRWISHACELITTVLLATPDLLLALGLLFLAVRSHWFHAGGMFSRESMEQDSWARSKDLAAHLALPVTVLVLGSLPLLLRHTRAAMLEVLDSPYVRASRALGVSPGRILFHHALPAAINPLLSLFGFSLGSLLSASLLTEVVMSWPGLGPLLLEAVLARDIYVVIGAVLFSTVLLVSGTLLADVLLFAADPRIRTEDLA
jgi:peptide/nickel transport system permease protein